MSPKAGEEVGSLTREDGPYLIAAALCERVLIEKNNTASLIRIIDQVVVQMPPSVQLPGGVLPSVPQVQPTVALVLAVMFKNGKLDGTRELRVAVKAPSGLRTTESKTTLLFQGGEAGGVNAFVNLVMGLGEEGVYWFEVWLGEDFQTKCPLRVVRLQTSVSYPPQP